MSVGSVSVVSIWWAQSSRAQSSRSQYSGSQFSWDQSSGHPPKVSIPSLPLHTLSWPIFLSPLFAPPHPAGVPLFSLPCPFFHGRPWTIKRSPLPSDVEFPPPFIPTQIWIVCFPRCLRHLRLRVFDDLRTRLASDPPPSLLSLLILFPTPWYGNRHIHRATSR